MKKKTAAAPPAGGDVPAHLQSAFFQQQQNQLGARFARQALSVTLVMGACLTLSLGLNGVLGWQVTHPPSHYFATEDGRLTPLYPTDQPANTLADVNDFGAGVIRRAFTLDFMHYRQQITAVSDDFDDAGYKSYYVALTHSNVLSAVRDKKMNLSVTVSPGVVTQKGLLSNGTYAWVIQYPVTVALAGQTTSVAPQNFIFSLYIRRADAREVPRGLQVYQLVTTNAP